MEEFISIKKFAQLVIKVYHNLFLKIQMFPISLFLY